MRLTLALLLVAGPLAAQTTSTPPSRPPDTTFTFTDTLPTTPPLVYQLPMRWWRDSIIVTVGPQRSALPPIWDFFVASRIVLPNGLPVDTVVPPWSCKAFWKCDSIVAPPTPTLTALSISPKAATVQAGKVQGFAATLTWSDGQQHGSASWSATGGSVTTSGGYTAGSAAGSFVVVASLSGKADTARVTVTVPTPPPPQNHVGNFASPSGSGSTCSLAAPCSLATAIGKSGSDTTWLRAGDYKGFNILSGTEIVRAYPSERVRITSQIILAQASVNPVLWGLEIAPSSQSVRQACVIAYGTNPRLINNVVHDCSEQGISFTQEAKGGELSGNIVYNAGTEDQLDHGIYANNVSGAKKLTDNVVFLSRHYGFHLFSGSPGQLAGMSGDGNVGFFSGLGNLGSDLIFTGTTSPGFTWTNFYGYNPWYSAAILTPAGGSGALNISGVVVGSPTGLGTVTGFSSVGKSGLTSTGTLPNQVIVRPVNRYEYGRGHVIVFNGAKALSVAADLSSFLKLGDPYAVRNVCDVFGTPVVSGSYSGPVSIPMKSIPAPQAIGRTPKRTVPACGVEFGVYLVTSR